MLARFLRKELAVGREIANGEIVLGNGPVGGVDGAIPDLVAARQLRGGEQMTIVHAAYAPEPLTRALGAQLGTIQRERPLDPGKRGDPGNLLVGGLGRLGRKLELHAQFLGRKTAVEVELPGDALEVAFGLERIAQGALGAAV